MIARIFLTSLALLLFTSPAQASFVPDQTVELHAHLFMKEGMSWMFHGDFFGPLQAHDYHDRFRSQANPETLEKSGLGIVVVSLYANPLLVMDLRDSIRRQITLAEKFVREHPQWIIAKGASEARAALNSGKRVLILELEGASGILENEQDYREFIDQRGIRIVTVLHLTDDKFGGVAFLRGIRALSTPLAWLKSLVRGSVHDGVRENPNGLTEDGRKLAAALIERGVWIDLAHSSDASQHELIPILEMANQPILYTHTALRRFHGAERGITDWQLAEVKKTRGIIGLMPSEFMLEGTTPPRPGCPSGIAALETQYILAVSAIGDPAAVMLGSDYNGGIPHLAPGCNTGTKLDSEGLWNISGVPEVWKALKKLGALTPDPLSGMEERFLESWRQVKP